MAEAGDVPVRIFLSSPSDVRAERLIAERLIGRLNHEFANHFQIEAVLWEREPLVASEHFQTSITPPRETDIVVVILWSRLGVPLPIERFPGPISRGEVTGTEWEFEDALSAYRARGLPDLLFYRKTASVMTSLDNADLVQQQLRQKQLVNQFVQRWFVGTDATTFTAAFREFGDAAQFEEMLSTHLRELLERRLEKIESAGARGAIRWHEGSPYRGLETFELHHAPIFFGRARERNELRELLARRAEAGSAFILVIGASGSGKSSVVRCGLQSDLNLPGMIGRVAFCRRAMFRPSDAPGDLLAGLAATILGPTALPELAEQHYDVDRMTALLRDAPQHAAAPIETALARASRDQLTATGEARLLLIVDQIEELFTIDRFGARARDVLVAALDALARSGHVWVIATMRSDFFQRLPDVPLLATMSADARYLLCFPNAAALAQIVQQPALEAGLRFETDDRSGVNLAQAIQLDAAQSPDALPLLEFALNQLWYRRTAQGELTFAAYHQLGGLKGAIGSRAEEEFLKQPADVQVALPGVLRAVATSAPGAGVTSRPAPLAQFPAGTPARRLIDALLSPSARLLVADGDGASARVRVAHEALLTHWERARQQLATDAADLQARTRLEQAAALWRDDHTARRATLLLNPGAPLAEAEDLLRRVPDALDSTTVAFITASSAAARRSRRNLQIAAASFALIALIAVIAALQAYAAANLARSGELAAEAERQMQTNPELAVLLAVAALDAQNTPRAENALRAALQRVQQFVLTGHRDRVRSAAFSPDGRWLVTASRDGDARIFSATGGNEHRTLSANAGPVHDAVFTADGRNVVTAGEDGSVRVWDASSGAPLRDLRGHDGPVYGIAAAANANIIASGGKDGTVRIWDIGSETARNVIRTWERDEVRAAINRVAFSPNDGSVLAAGDNFDATVWNVDDGRLVVRLPHTGYVVSGAFSPDGQRIAIASGERVHVWRLDDAGPPPLLHCTGLCGAVAFDAEGERMAVGSESGRTDIYRTGDLTVERELIGHGFVRSVAFSGTGVIATAGDDATVRVWTTDRPQRQFADHAAQVANAAFSPDGRLVVTASGEQVSIWHVATGSRRNAFNAGTREVISALFSPDGRFIVTAGDAGSPRVWTSDGTLYRDLPGHTGTVNSATFSTDSRQIVTASKDGRVRVFNAESGGLVREFPSEGGEAVVAVFSPDARLVAAGHADGAVRVWNTADGTIRQRTPPDDSPVYGVAFSRDGTSLATATLNGNVRLWDTPTFTRTREFKSPSPVVSVEFSADGRFIVAAGGRTASIRDVSTGQVVMSATPGSNIRGAAFRPDGRAIVTAHVDRTARIFACDLCVSGSELKALAGERVKRGFTDNERALYPVTVSRLRNWIAP